LRPVVSVPCKLRGQEAAVVPACCPHTGTLPSEGCESVLCSFDPSDACLAPVLCTHFMILSSLSSTRLMHHSSLFCPHSACLPALCTHSSLLPARLMHSFLTYAPVPHSFFTQRSSTRSPVAASNPPPILSYSGATRALLWLAPSHAITHASHARWQALGKLASAYLVLSS
jgi:hypothetical protein